MYDYFKTEKAVYRCRNGKHYIHLNEWDKIPSFKYHDQEITAKEYNRAYRAKGRSKQKKNEGGCNMNKNTLKAIAKRVNAGLEKFTIGERTYFVNYEMKHVLYYEKYLGGNPQFVFFDKLENLI